jgi:hypothetical protein
MVTGRLVPRRQPGAPATAPAIPWARPKHELLLLVLVALAALTPIYAVSAQDISRLCLTRSLLEGHLSISPCVGHAFDQARFSTRAYSDKAPGMSVLALPATAALGLPAPSRWRPSRDASVWAVRVLTGGIAFVLLGFAVGRVSEGLCRRSGGLVLVTLALGTILGALAATTFGHVTAGLLCFGSFLFAWRRRWLVAGLLGGIVVCVEYQATLVVAMLVLYAVASGGRSLVRYAAGLVPGAALLGAYDTLAFGSPFHLSYRYIANKYASEQSRGVFGITVPRWHSAAQVLIGDRGLLVSSPVLIAALGGLILLARQHRAEAVTCAAVFLGFLFLSTGYFLPYGGVSPGPRFLVPALPFLALGLGPAYARRPVLTVLLVVPSLVASTALTLTWALAGTRGYRQSIWGELAREVTRSRPRLGSEVASNAATFAGLHRPTAAVVVSACTLAAFAVALASLRARDGKVESC